MNQEQLNRYKELISDLSEDTKIILVNNPQLLLWRVAGNRFETKYFTRNQATGERETFSNINSAEQWIMKQLNIK